MNTIISRTCLFFLFIALTALGDNVVFLGEWKTTGKVHKRFDTAIGSLYEFSRKHEFRSNIEFLDWTPKHKSNCDCYQCNPPDINSGILQLELKKYTRKNLKKYRYIAVDFKIRIFPAISRDNSAEAKFIITHSPKNRIDSEYKDLNGMFLHNPWSSSMIEYITSNVNIFSRLRITSGEYFMPKFEPIALRIIFDRHNERKTLYYLNNLELELVEPFSRFDEQDDKVLNIHNIGFFTINSRIGKRSRYVELSKPMVHLFNEKSDIPNLPKLKFMTYPYSIYLAMAKISDYNSTIDIYRKIKRQKNPDLQYAVALAMLYGEERYHNPALAAKWLLDLARRDNHALAYRELAVCYAYGYGVKPNIRKASIYFERADGYGCREAKYQKLNFLKWNSKWLWDAYRIPANANLKKPEIREYEETFFICQHNTGYNKNLLTNQTPLFTHSIRNPKFAMQARSLYNMDFYRKDSLGKTVFLYDDLISQGYSEVYTSRWGDMKFISPAQALADLRMGSKHGDPIAMAEELLYDVLHNKATKERFSLNLELKLRRHISYWLAKMLFFNRDNPQVNCAIKNGKLDYKSWEKYDTPLTNFLMWLALNYNTIEYGVSLPFWLNNKDVEKHQDSSIYWENRYLSKAIAAEMPEALFFGGFVDIYKNRNRTMHGSLYVNIWKQAAKLGCSAAKYESILLTIESGSYAPLAVLKDLDIFLKNGYPEAFYLAGKAYLHLGESQKAELYFRQAISTGYHKGWQMLALEAQKEKATQANSIKYWYNYIKESRKALAHDRRSSFAFDIYEELHKYEHNKGQYPLQIKYHKGK